MGKRFHMCIDIRGFLKNHPRDTDPVYQSIMVNGNPVEPLMFRHELHLAMERGDKVYPTNGCDNFDPQRGCLGHEESKVTEDLATS